MESRATYYQRAATLGNRATKDGRGSTVWLAMQEQCVHDLWILEDGQRSVELDCPEASAVLFRPQVWKSDMHRLGCRVTAMTGVAVYVPLAQGLAEIRRHLNHVASDILPRIPIAREIT